MVDESSSQAGTPAQDFAKAIISCAAARRLVGLGGPPLAGIPIGRADLEARRRLFGRRTPFRW